MNEKEGVSVRRRAGWAAALAAVLAVLLAPAQASAAPSISNLSPANGAVLPYGTDVNRPFLRFTCASYSTSLGTPVSYYDYWWRISTSPSLGPDGLLRVPDIVAMGQSYPVAGSTNVCENFGAPPFVLRPGTYYWQAYAIDCEQPSCHLTGPVSRFAIREPPRAEPPNTYWTSKPPKTSRKKRVVFKFAANATGPASFECKYARGWSACSSPQSFRLGPGRYTFRVRAVAGGLRDPSPASWSFRIRRR